MALCHYYLTGELLQSDVGSAVMFSLPPGGGEVSLDESALQARRGIFFDFLAINNLT